MKNLFIDANIWLSLYHFTKDNFEKFEALKGLLKDEINLIVPEQVYHEVLRNRDGKVKSAWDQFCNFNFQIPAFCQSYPEYTDFLRLFRQLKEKHDNWKQTIEQDILNHTLKADMLISELYLAAEIKECSPEILSKAELRYKSGNPPGKNNSLGDAINWEFLLQFVPNGENLYFISADKDYRSEFDDKKFNYFLDKEWKRKKKSKIVFFTSLYAFLQDHANASAIQEDPQPEAGDKKREEQEKKRKAIVELAESIEKSSVEEKKNNAISLLQNSRSFANTHNAISLLAKYDSWTQDQIETLCEAALTNDQIWTIIYDEDLVDFFTGILKASKEETPSVISLRKVLVPDYEEQLNNLFK